MRISKLKNSLWRVASPDLVYGEQDDDIWIHTRLKCSMLVDWTADSPVVREHAGKSRERPDGNEEYCRRGGRVWGSGAVTMEDLVKRFWRYRG